MLDSLFSTECPSVYEGPSSNPRFEYFFLMHNRLLNENQNFLGGYRRFPVIAPLKTVINHLILMILNLKRKLSRQLAIWRYIICIMYIIICNLDHIMIWVSIKLRLNKYNYSYLYAVFAAFMQISCVFHPKILHFFNILILPRIGEG